jgi:hypothetical protein
MSPALENLLFGILMVLFSLAAFRYLTAVRAWLRRLREVAGESPTLEARERFMASDEYRELRRRAQRPIQAAVFLLLALFLLMRFSGG